MKSVRDVRIVAVLFLIAGVAAVVQMILTRVLEVGTTGLLALPTGIGLLRYSNAWRIVALVILWISLAVFIIAMGMWLVNGSAVSVTFWVRSPAVIAVLIFLSFSLTVWEIRVLTRPDVRRSFELGDPAA
ncbi:MAG: hypothetical protein M3167_15065 [Acidobacteriota bacterium]|nr:hypothetical protein [Acidobacteriota bacterium]